jgi:hypothetical protein
MLWADCLAFRGVVARGLIAGAFVVGVHLGLAARRRP